MLPGMPMGLLGREPFGVISFVASSTSLGANIQVPAGVQDGDLAYMFTFAVGSPTPVSVAPAGWTAVSYNEFITNVARFQRFQRLLLATDAGSWVDAIVGDDNNAHSGMMVFRHTLGGSWATRGISGSGLYEGGQSSSSIGSGAASAPCVAVAAHISDVAVTGETFSPAADASISVAGNTLRMRYKIFNTLPASNITITRPYYAGSIASVGCGHVGELT